MLNSEAGGRKVQGRRIRKFVSWPYGKNTRCEFRLIKLTQFSYHVAFRYVLCYNAEMYILIDQLEAFEDPRTGNAKRHKLGDILFIAIAAGVAGADTWYEIVEYAHTHEAFFRKYLELPSGIPSHDTFNRVFAIMDTRILDDEDRSRKRVGNAAENYSRLMRVVMSLLKRDRQRPGFDKPLRRKRKLAAWNTVELERILFGLPGENN